MKRKIRWTDHIIELLIVIMGISIAFGLNNIASSKKYRELEVSYLIDLKDDLVKDSLRLYHNINFKRSYKLKKT